MGKITPNNPWPLFCTKKAGERRDVDIETLRLFCDVFKLNGFTQAAAANSLTQSAVSQRIKALEKKFGTTLIERHGIELRLTKAGEAVYKGATRILAELREVEDHLHAINGQIGGSVKVAAIYSAGLYELEPFVKKFLKSHPDVDVEIEYSKANKIYQDVISGSIDLGIVAYPINRPQLHWIPFHEDVLVLICSPDHPFFRYGTISLKQVASQPFVTFHRDIPTRRAIDAIFKKQGVSVTIKAEFDNIDLIKRAVEINLGISLVPSVTVKSEIQGGMLKALALTEGPFIRPIAVLYRRGRSLPVPVKKFIAVLTGNDP